MMSMFLSMKNGRIAERIWYLGLLVKDPYDFRGMIKFLIDSENEENIHEFWVPHSTYCLINGERKVVGAVIIRHRLNQKLLNSGGHIGYGIRPFARRKSYASVLLSLVLQKTKELGLHKVLVVCDKGNLGSERTIIKTGGSFESEYIEDNGNVVRRFWIEL